MTTSVKASPSGAVIELRVATVLVVPPIPAETPPATVSIAAPGVLPTDAVAVLLLGGALLPSGLIAAPLPVCVSPGVVQIVCIDATGAGQPGGTFPVLVVAYR